MRPFRWLHAAATSLLSVLYPRACLACDAPLETTPCAYLCPRCEEDVRFVGAEACARCGKPRRMGGRGLRRCRMCRGRTFSFRRAVVAAHYEGVVQRSVLALKFRGMPLFARPMGEWLVQALLHEPWLREVDLVVPVPLHAKRLRERGYNQAAELGRVVAQAIDRPLLPRALVRLRATRRQARLPVDMRRSNPAGAFAARDRRLRGRRVLLVDDVLTTAATADACARAMREAGARDVYVAVVAG